jgi:hypothetical protein
MLPAGTLTALLPGLFASVHKSKAALLTPSCPAFGPGIQEGKDAAARFLVVDGRAKPGHDAPRNYRGIFGQRILT